MDEYTREPCPWRIVDDAGGAFSMGLIGGGIFHSIKGYRNAPTGFSRRLAGSLTAIKTRAPFTGRWTQYQTVKDVEIEPRIENGRWSSSLAAVATVPLLSKPYRKSHFSELCLWLIFPWVHLSFRRTVPRDTPPAMIFRYLAPSAEGLLATWSQ